MDTVLSIYKPDNMSIVEIINQCKQFNLEFIL